ncbi:MAG: DUF3783 domain-containing protein [Lachnospiraceae bacterium]|nr:DUF3783 domain-containing protein [Lachnospiraceae bacterium]
MKERILLFQFDPVKRRKLTAQLVAQKFRVKAVTETELGQSLGELAGDESIQTDRSLTEASAEDAPAGGEEIALDAPMLLMAGVTGSRMDAVIQAIKRANIGKVPYKAILTETNRRWKPVELLEELKKEHETMKESDGQRKTHES